MRSQAGTGYGIVEFESEELAQGALFLSGATVALQPERPDLLSRITVVRRLLTGSCYTFFYHSESAFWYETHEGTRP